MRRAVGFNMMAGMWEKNPKSLVPCLGPHGMTENLNFSGFLLILSV